MDILRRSKKADLNLSVQAIVILIFAVIMLGLGLGLIHFIFGSAREKVAQSLAVTELSVQPTSDKPVTIESEVSIKFKGEKKTQIGFYNFKSSSLQKVAPKIVLCLTADGKEVDEASLPTVAAPPKPSMDPGIAEGWGAIIKLPDTLDTGAVSGTGFSGALTPGTYICSIGIVGCTPTSSETACIVAPEAMPIKTTDFTLKVTS
ncbi:hypothetical protein COV19_06705 [Candidatus Woesearchaeota archaeon CG10_big_fil_rev_8_21_14_0_10_44_13]|nr:MAG: hypothetical protein COV19_06705 [Candidatus Woesearchaeota archaeon CG10_big_fil_rev_8_21_14_0_10_44_13]